MSSSGKRKIFLFASEIAVITGHNPYQKPKRVIDRLISEYFPELLEGVPTVPLTIANTLNIFLRKTTLMFLKSYAQQIILRILVN